MSIIISATSRDCAIEAAVEKCDPRSFREIFLLKLIAKELLDSGYVRSLVDAAVSAEREACAAIADGLARSTGSVDRQDWSEEIAERIRARKP